MPAATGLESLLALQERDGALDRLTHQRATLPERDDVARRTAGVAELDTRIGAIARERDELARQLRELDDEARSLREKASAVEAKMYSGSVSSPRELQAMQADVEQLHRHEQTLESRELELMEVLEPLDRDLRELGAQRSALVGELDAARDALGRAEGAIDEEMAAERSARDTIAADVDPALIAEYNRRRAQTHGVGVARLVGNTCQGCHLTIPATEVERIRKSAEGLITSCDNCGCILIP